MYFYGIAISKRDPRRLYAAGRANSPEPQALALYASSDGGASWVALVNHSATYGGVRDMVLVDHHDTEKIYLGTDQGVYAYELSDS